MNKSITADVTITKQTSQRMVIEWPDNLGDPTDANVLKALRDGTVDYDDIIYEDGNFRESLYAMSLKRLKRKCEKYAKRERKAIAYVATLKEES